jgi:8-oxo-dGTP diphosphatase
MHYFCGQTVAVDQDIVLGEGRWIGFIPPEHALNRDLSASAALVVPIFLSSDTYADLRARKWGGGL